MTATIEDTNAPVLEDEDTKGAAGASSDEDEDEDSKSRDFTKFTKSHEEIAAFINANEDFQKAELGVEVSAGLVKAIFALRTDFNNTPERKAAAEERKAKRELEKKKFEGMSAEAIKAEKAAAKAEEQAKKLQARVEEALAKAQKLREGTDATGEDVAAAVAAEQAPTEEPKKTIGRSGRK